MNYSWSWLLGGVRLKHCLCCYFLQTRGDQSANDSLGKGVAVYLNIVRTQWWKQESRVSQTPCWCFLPFWPWDSCLRIWKFNSKELMGSPGAKWLFVLVRNEETNSFLRHQERINIWAKYKGWSFPGWEENYYGTSDLGWDPCLLLILKYIYIY